MSSTNRSDARDLHIADYYVTPPKAIEDFLCKFMFEENIYLSDKLILDPCAGGDINNSMSYPLVLNKLGAKNIITNDIREDSPSQYHSDFLLATQKDKYDIVITNPPFNIAQNIIEKSLEICKEGGYVIMLLRLNYFGGKVRQDFWKNNMPYKCYVHNRRMSFTPDGKTDSVEYMHCVWKKGSSYIETRLSLIFDF